MKIKWTTGAYECGSYYDPGDECEMEDAKALLFIERGVAVAVLEAAKIAEVPIETAELPPAAETTTTKYKRVR